MRHVLLAALGLLLAAGGALADVPATQLERAVAHGRSQLGVASWYGPGFAWRAMANGRPFDPMGHSCAHRTLPFRTLLLVTVVASGRSEICRVEDRGPFIHGRLIDLSQGAARRLGIEQRGIALVTLDPLPGSP